MKKLIFILVLMMLSIMANANPIEIDGINYNLNTIDKTAEVTCFFEPNGYGSYVSFPGYFGSVVIPNSIIYKGDTYIVTSFGSVAFQGCTGLTFVSIPNSVTSIGNSAFNNCTSLASIILSNSLTDLGDRVFYGCTSLTSVTIPNSVTSIGICAFYWCTSLKSVDIPNSVTSIGDLSFYGCKNLTSITIPNSVTSIGDAVFWKCFGLTSVTIPNSVTSIGDRAFEYCSGLTSITIGNSVTSIGERAFSGCQGLTDVYCYASEVPNTSAIAFQDLYIKNVTLHVPAASVNLYKQAEPWNGFGKIVALDGSTQETKKCATPTISYSNGKLMFSCATDGAEFVTDVTDADIKKHYNASISLTATYNISVYATKEGYENSDVATATLCWIDVEPRTEGITNGTASVRANAVLIQTNSGILTVIGAPEGSEVSVYSLNGQNVGFARASSETTHIDTTLKSGEVGIVRIGDRAVKVVMK